MFPCDQLIISQVGTKRQTTTRRLTCMILFRMDIVSSTIRGDAIKSSNRVWLLQQAPKLYAVDYLEPLAFQWVIVGRSSILAENKANQPRLSDIG